MEGLLSLNLTGNLLLIIFAFLSLFHILVLIGFVSHEIIWAGRIKSKSDLIKLESVSLIILFMSTIIVGMKLEYFDLGLSSLYINTGLWILFILFLLNTIGNIFSKNKFEKYAFGTLTIIITFLVFQMVMS
jgi:hypothetical protein